MAVTKLEHIISTNTVTAVWQQLSVANYISENRTEPSSKKLNLVEEGAVSPLARGVCFP
jgi:hypothetical protein